MFHSAGNTVGLLYACLYAALSLFSVPRTTTVVAAMLLLGVAHRAQGATFDWAPLFVSGSQFGAAFNWTPSGGPPVAGDTARFNLGAASTATFNFSPTNAVLQHQSGDTIFRPSGTFATYTLTSASSITGGNLTVNPDAIFRLNLDFTSLSLSGDSTLTVNAGAVSNSSSLNVGNTSAASMILNGLTTSYTNTSTGQSTLGFSSGGFGSLTFSNGATGTMAGSLRIGGASTIGGDLQVLSGSTLSFGTANIGNGTFVGQTGTVLVDGIGSSITQTGGSILNLGKAAAGTASITVLNGGIYNTGAGLTTVNATGSINISGGSSQFNANGDVNVVGGSITRSSGAFNLAAGRTLTATGGAQIDLGGGTTLSGGTTWNIQSGADLFSSDFMDIGHSGGVTEVTIDGTGSSLTTGIATSFWGDFGHTAQVTIRNGASASVGGIDLARSSTAGTTGALSVESGAEMTTGHLFVARNGGATTTGTITVTGSGSSITQTGVLGIGDTGGPPLAAQVNVFNNGTFNTSTILTSVFESGHINIDGGTFNANGNVNVNGGSITKVTGSFNLASGRTLTATGGAQIDLGALVSLSGGTTWNIQSGSELFTVGFMNIGTSGGITAVTIDGAGSRLATGSESDWGFGHTAQVTVRNGAVANVGGINLARSTSAGTTGILTVESGATMTVAGALTVARHGGATTTGTVTVTGTGSTLTLTGAGQLLLGDSTSGTATLNVEDGGTFDTGTGQTVVRATGSINISGTGSAFNAGGDVSVSGGSITRTGGNFNLASGRTLFANNGAQIDLGTSAQLSGGTTWRILSGAGLSSSGSRIGTSGGVTDIAIDGAGSTLTIAGGVGSTSTWGSSGHTAHVTVRNDAVASVSTTFLNLAASSSDGTSGTITVETGATMTTGHMSAAGFGGATTTGTITVTGTGSSLTQTGSSILTLGHASTGTATLDVLDGGTFSTGTGGTNVNATGSINIGGSGSAFNANGDVNVNGGSITRTRGSFNLASGRTLTASNGAQINFGDNITLLSGGTTWNITNGADLVALEGIAIGHSGGVTTVTIDGAGSSWTAISNIIMLFWGANGHTAQVTVRNGAAAEVSGINLAGSADAGTTGILAVESGASMTTQTLFVAIDGGATTTGTVTVTGTGSSLTQTGASTLRLGHASTGTATLNVLDGGTFTAGTDGTVLHATGTINIDGGFANLGPLNLQGGAISFLAGSLSYGGDLTVGSGGLLGADLTLTATKQLALTGTTTINPFRTLTIDGGRFSTGELLVQSGGVFDFKKGTLAITGAGGFIIGAAGPLGAHLQVAPGAVIEVSNGLTNEGLISGGGVVVAAIDNTLDGEVRAEAGNTLFFDGAGHSNSGEVRLLGGWAEFGGDLTNASTGRITGRGTLSTTAGLTNQGHIALSSGITDVYGDVTNNTADASIGITVSGNADATFWGDVTNTSGLFRVSANSSATFFGTFAGAGISGPGDVYFEADITPGSSPGLAEFGGNVHFGPLANLEIELAGTTRGTQYDALDVAGTAALDGTLAVSLLSGFMPAAGDVFEIITAASISGTFANEILPALTGNLSWNIDYGANSVTLAVAAPGLPGDLNGDGAVNAADYVFWRKNALPQEQYDEWRTNFGATAGSGGGSALGSSSHAAVPEPASAWLLLVALMGTVLTISSRWRRGR